MRWFSRWTLLHALVLCAISLCFVQIKCQRNVSLSSHRRTRRQALACFTLEGIPGKCVVPDACLFPSAVKLRLFRSQCLTAESRRGICCPGGTASTATPFRRLVQQPNNFQRFSSFNSFQQSFNQPQRFQQTPADNVRQQNFFPSFTEIQRPTSVQNVQFRPSTLQQTTPRPVTFPTQNDNFLFQPRPVVESLPELPVDDLHTACDESVNCLLTTDRPETFLTQGQPNLQLSSPVNSNTRQNIISNTISSAQPAVTRAPALTDDCPETPVCVASKYRTFDGSCNNVNNPNLGKSFFAFPRLIPPAYADGMSTPRRAADGSDLPSPRLVSASLVTDANMPDPFNTNMIMAFGQFLDHDLTRTAINKGPNNTGIACCRREMIENPSLRHAECLPISIPTNDPFYGQFNQTCMEFVRSLAAPRPDCRVGPREQMNQITSFIDASNIYGSTKEESNDLRTFQGGKLQVSRVNNADMLPFVTTKPDFCSKPDQGLFCFKAGDTRVNEQISLTVIHTVWMREHNRIASQLASVNPDWSDEIIYLETRRIIGAILQHIVYNEFLPVLLGRNSMRLSSLLLQREGYSNDYDPTVNPAITNEFATAAYRFGHTLIPGKFTMFDNRGQPEDVSLRKEFNRPFHLFKADGLDSCLRGLCTQRSQQFDTFITEEVTNHLFERTRPFGLDLVAINLQRGRDHGLPGYNRFRQFCGLPSFRTFDDLLTEMHSNYVNLLRQLYRSVDDIDLFVAGIAEKPLNGAKLGPTFGCILSEQFKRTKKGDRFWYENGSNSPFSPGIDFSLYAQ
ncbi:hypothetical protein CHUAL_010797 [Chamberlinius hualienensis]